MAEWMEFTGKVIIVTGGSRGIGEHVVKILRRNNATVIVADLTQIQIMNQMKIFYLSIAMLRKKTV